MLGDAKASSKHQSRERASVQSGTRHQGIQSVEVRALKTEVQDFAERLR